MREDKLDRPRDSIVDSIFRGWIVIRMFQKSHSFALIVPSEQSGTDRPCTGVTLFYARVVVDDSVLNTGQSRCPTSILATQASYIFAFLSPPC